MKKLLTSAALIGAVVFMACMIGCSIYFGDSVFLVVVHSALAVSVLYNAAWMLRSIWSEA